LFFFVFFFANEKSFVENEKKIVTNEHGFGSWQNTYFLHFPLAEVTMDTLNDLVVKVMTSRRFIDWIRLGERLSEDKTYNKNFGGVTLADGTVVSSFTDVLVAFEKRGGVINKEFCSMLPHATRVKMPDRRIVTSLQKGYHHIYTMSSGGFGIYNSLQPMAGIRELRDEFDYLAIPQYEDLEGKKQRQKAQQEWQAVRQTRRFQKEWQAVRQTRWFQQEWQAVRQTRWFQHVQQHKGKLGKQ
jgi:hypothetical protein